MVGKIGTKMSLAGIGWVIASASASVRQSVSADTQLRFPLLLTTALLFTYDHPVQNSLVGGVGEGNLSTNEQLIFMNYRFDRFLCLLACMRILFQHFVLIAVIIVVVFFFTCLLDSEHSEKGG